MQRPGTHGTNWPPETHPLPPPLGRPPPPPPPTRPLAPPLSRHPPPPPPPRPLPSNNPPVFPPPPPLPNEPTTTPTLSSPPLPPSQPSIPPLPTPEEHPAPPKLSPQSSSAATGGLSTTEKSASTSEKGGFERMKLKPGGGLLGKRASGGTISMKFGASKGAPDAKKPKPSIKKPPLVSQAFGNESDEEEEMPPEAKLRMRNVGKDTPTSAGPNSFYKGKMGFSDPRAGYKRYNEDDY